MKRFHAASRPPMCTSSSEQWPDCLECENFTSMQFLISKGWENDVHCINKRLKKNLKH